jgi:hypothetical protein
VIRRSISLPRVSPTTGDDRVPNRAPFSQDVPVRLKALARRVGRLGLGGRFDPEHAFLEREEVVQALLGLARELERVEPKPPARPAPAAIPSDRTRRLAALLAGRQREIDRLRILLAQAVRPSRRRRRAVPDAQLSLPLPEAPHER